MHVPVQPSPQKPLSTVRDKPPLQQAQPLSNLPLTSSTTKVTRRELPHSTAPTPELPQSDAPTPQEVTIETKDKYKKQELDRSHDEGDAVKHRRTDDDDPPGLLLLQTSRHLPHKNKEHFSLLRMEKHCNHPWLNRLIPP